MFILSSYYVEDPIDRADDKVADPHQVLRCAAQGPCPVCYDLQKSILNKFILKMQTLLCQTSVFRLRTSICWDLCKAKVCDLEMTIAVEK